MLSISYVKTPGDFVEAIWTEAWGAEALEAVYDADAMIRRFATKRAIFLKRSVTY